MQVQPALQPALLDLRNSFRPKIPKSLLICIWNFTWKFSSLQHFVGCWRLYVGFLPSQMNVVQKWKYFTNVTKPLTSASHEKLQWKWLQSQEKIVCFNLEWNVFWVWNIFWAAKANGIWYKKHQSFGPHIRKKQQESNRDFKTTKIMAS